MTEMIDPLHPVELGDWDAEWDSSLSIVVELPVATSYIREILMLSRYNKNMYDTSQTFIQVSFFFFFGSLLFICGLCNKLLVGLVKCILEVIVLKGLVHLSTMYIVLYEVFKSYQSSRTQHLSMWRGDGDN